MTRTYRTPISANDRRWPCTLTYEAFRRVSPSVCLVCLHRLQLGFAVRESSHAALCPLRSCSRRSSCNGAARIWRSSRCNGAQSCASRGRRYGAAHIAGACMAVIIGDGGDECRARQERRPCWVWLGLEKRCSPLVGGPPIARADRWPHRFPRLWRRITSGSLLRSVVPCSLVLPLLDFSVAQARAPSGARSYGRATSRSSRSAAAARRRRGHTRSAPS
jgi:hypothetical protein